MPINGDSKNHYYVDFYNHGPGPLIIKGTAFQVEDKIKKHIFNVIDAPSDDGATLSPVKPIGASPHDRIAP